MSMQSDTSLRRTLRCPKCRQQFETMRRFRVTCTECGHEWEEVSVLTAADRRGLVVGALHRQALDDEGPVPERLQRAGTHLVFAGERDGHGVEPKVRNETGKVRALLFDRHGPACPGHP